MNHKGVGSPNEDDQSLKHSYLSFKGASVLWPPDCPDDVLEQAITWAKNFQSSCKVGIHDEDGSPRSNNAGSKSSMVRETNYELVGWLQAGGGEAQARDGPQVQAILARGLREELRLLRSAREQEFYLFCARRDFFPGVQGRLATRKLKDNRCGQSSHQLHI